MTPVVSGEILTRESTVQDDSIIVFMENCIYRIDPHATLVAPVEDENTIQKSISPFQKGG